MVSNRGAVDFESGIADEKALSCGTVHWALAGSMVGSVAEEHYIG